MQRSCIKHMISKAWIFFRVDKQGLCLTAVEEDGDDKRLACEVDGVAPPDPV